MIIVGIEFEKRAFFIDIVRMILNGNSACLFFLENNQNFTYDICNATMYMMYMVNA